MTFAFIRVLFVLLSTVLGFQLGSAFQGVGNYWSLIGIGVGAAVALVVILIEHTIGKVSMRGLSAAVFGLILAFIVSKFLTSAIDLVPELGPTFSSTLKLIIVLILSYFGMVFSMRGRDEFNLIIPYVKFDRQDQRDMVLILDTSVLLMDASWIFVRPSLWKAVLLFQNLY